MPELPDVEVYRKYIDSTSLDQPLNDVRVISTMVLGEGISPSKFADETDSTLIQIVLSPRQISDA